MRFFSSSKHILSGCGGTIHAESKTTGVKFDAGTGLKFEAEVTHFGRSTIQRFTVWREIEMDVVTSTSSLALALAWEVGSLY